MPVAHAAGLLRVNAKQWRRIEHYVGVARAQEDMRGVAMVGIDDLSFRRGQDDVTLVHDIEAKHLLLTTERRKHGTVIDFKADLIVHGGDPDDIKHVCMDMSAAHIEGVTEMLPQAQISFDRFHVIALANEAMDTVRREEMRDQLRVVRAAMGTGRDALKGMFWGMRKDHSDWSVKQINTMYRLQRSNLKSARAWRLKEELRSTYVIGVTSNCPEQAETALKGWISCARRSRLEPFKKLATMLKDRLAGVVRGILDERSNAYVEAMNGMLQ